MRRLISRLLLVCFLASAFPVAQAAQNPKAKTAARRRSKALKKRGKKQKPAKWGKAKRRTPKTGSKRV
jgi:Ni/Co efflux regulator RcnB